MMRTVRFLTGLVMVVTGVSLAAPMATRLVEAARFWAKLTKCDLPGEPWHPERVYYYACVHLKLVRSPAFVVDVTATWDAKRASLACYASQFDATAAPPTVLDRVEAASRWWGACIGRCHGEPFYAREPIGLAGFGDLF